MIKLLHTADWHIGQTLHGEDRSQEQQDMLEQITQCVADEKPDIMLLAGDIFDVQTPNTKAQKMLTQALVAMHNAHPQMTIISISGNHDSASRHETHQAVWSAVDVHTLGNVHNNDIHQHILPIYDAQSSICAYVVALPYASQRMISDDLYERLHQLSTQLGDEHQVPVIFLGHLAASSCETLGHEISTYGNDTLYIGNIESMDIAQIGQNYDYVALGHIHKAQNLNLRARYAGSPIAMSFDEVSRDYRHSISIVEIAHRGAQPVIREVEIIPSIPLVNIPAEDAAEWEKVLAELQRFPDDIPARIRIKVLLQHDEKLPFNYEWQIKEALAGKLARHCDTHVQRQLKDDIATPTQESVKMELSELKNMQPIEVARKWMERKGMQMTPEMEELFNYAMQQALESERYED